MKRINLQNITWKEGKHHVAQCLNVDVSSFGDSRREALVNLNEALTLYFEDSPKSTVTRIERPEVFRTALRHA